MTLLEGGDHGWKRVDNCSSMSATKFEFEVRVTIRGHNRSILSRASEIGPSGIIVPLPHELQPGEQVELAMADSTLYGHVVHSRPKPPSFQSLIEVERVTLGSTELSRILQRVLLDKLPEIKGVVSMETEPD